ncbi:unnamed protein product [Hymenolepis diminuta]|uniref:Uncharacterized protein n=1 Tax=Hymenolepis diminuta TaxID=6216 RepID=A0A564Y1K4_HYMDI|nr:unnamed protein product [Hymenolepis diminuta]
MFSRVLTQVTHIKLSLFSTQKQRTHVSYPLLRFLLISSLPQHAPLPIPPSLPLTCFKFVVVSLNKFCSNQLLVFCSTIVVSSYSNSYDLMIIIAVVIC